MMKLTLLSLCILGMSLSGCHENDNTNNEFGAIPGIWVPEVVTLDGNVQNDWHSTTFEVQVQESEQLIMICKNQPEQRVIIWPNESTLSLVSKKNSQIFYFKRDDNIDINLNTSPESLMLSMHPSRELSYESECPDDDSHLICQEEGKWLFKLLKQ